MRLTDLQVGVVGAGVAWGVSEKGQGGAGRGMSAECRLWKQCTWLTFRWSGLGRCEVSGTSRGSFLTFYMHSSAG